MISWYMMLQAIVRFVFFFAILRQAWSVDKYVQDNALASLTKTTPVIEQTTAANVSGVTTTTTTPELEKPAVVVEDTVAVTAISEDSLRTIAQIPGLNNLSVPNGAYLKPFLVPRVVGTESHRKVQDYIRKTFTDLGWKIDEDRFNASTPLGIKSFNNIVATKFPDATRQLVLSAHYDSKYFAPPDENKFIGATDSSVPCAMLVDIATSLNSRLDRLRDTDRGLQIIFFDGEEAFKTWTHTDSIYGSRHLAEVWSQKYHDSKPGSSTPRKTYLQSIELFVLLDLLGAKNPVLKDLQAPTSSQFRRIADLERQLAKLGLLGVKGQSVSGPIPKNIKAETDAALNDYFFQPMNSFEFHSGIEDDHLPFVAKNVPVIHLIPPTFPAVWHELTDNASALDEPSIRHLTIVMRVFVADYLGLL